MASGIKKVHIITQIVRLRHLVRRWKAKSRTPPGSLAVYVGPDRHRFVIPTRFLNLPVFLALLHQAEEEFGFHTSGPLALPCDPHFFSQILQFLHNDEHRFRSMPLDDFLLLAFDPSFPSCKEQSSSSSSSYGFAPLLQKTSV